jgi:hypothetical protein
MMSGIELEIWKKQQLKKAVNPAAFRDAEIIEVTDLNYSVRIGDIVEHHGCDDLMTITKVRHVTIKLQCDGREFDSYLRSSSGVFMPTEYLKSVGDIKGMGGRKAGLFFGYDLFTCTCGVPGCMGWHYGIPVLKLHENVIWYICDQEKLKPPKKFQFPLQEYFDLGDRLQKEIDTFSKIDPPEIKIWYYE